MAQLHSYCALVKNITIKVDDAVYQKARERAARRGTSVSAMVREFLSREDEEERLREDRRIEAMRELYAIAEKRRGETCSPVVPLSREEIYEPRLR